jgi:hypothetical protein
MFHSRTSSLLWATSLASVALVGAEPAMIRRDPCNYSCPPADMGFYPLAPGSGPTGGVLACFYPFLSYCTYSPVSHTHFLSFVLHNAFVTIDRWLTGARLGLKPLPLVCVLQRGLMHVPHFR